MADKEIKSFNIKKVSNKTKDGYIFKVNLEQPKHLKRMDNDYILISNQKMHLTDFKLRQKLV